MKCRTCALLAVLVLLSGCRSFERVEEDRDKPYNVIITTRDRWPVSVPLRAKIEYDGPWFYELPVTATAKARLPGGQRISQWLPPVQTFVQWTPEYMFGDKTQVVGDLPPDARAVKFDASVRGDYGWPFPQWSRTISVPIEIVAAVEQAMTPVRDPGIDAAFAEGDSMFLKRQRWKWNTSWGLWHVSIEGLPPSILELMNVTFGVSIEVLRDGVAVADGEAWWRTFETGSGPHLRGHLADYDVIALRGDRDALDTIGEDRAEWALRIRSNPVLALRDFESNSYWDGDVTIPLVARQLLVDRTPDGWDHEWTTIYPADAD